MDSHMRSAGDERQRGPWTQEKGDKEATLVMVRMRQGSEDDQKAEGMREFIELCGMKFGLERKKEPGG